MKKLGRLGIPGLIVGVVLVIYLCLTLLYYTEIGMASDIGIRQPVFNNVDFSAVPPSVVADAEKVADELAGNDQDYRQKIMDQLVGSYIAAGNSDIVIFFNSGGMGWNDISNTPGWESILNGITAEVQTLGFKPLVLNYARSSRGILGTLKETVESACRYPKKTAGMEKRVEFLADHLPGMKIIIAGESTGTVITEEVMSYFRDNTNVYSIQTGNPFWYKVNDQARTLRIDGNGRGNDAFSHGDVPAMVWSTAKSWFGLSSPEENAGNVLKSFRAPGHDYSWQYTSISSEMTQFLKDIFVKKADF